ncbi:ATP-binding protein [Enterococcus asini]|uniref:sensor histidine kinase n=1 Tax=Enterococcus asini TaxID=57732 RepID=UPI00288C8EB1|nr:ATP-binding protein [Enterococcus asini]MDT2762964.1 ATP-binding protein [Enterococcus asini]
MKKQLGEYLGWLAVLLVIFIGAWQLIAGFYHNQVVSQQQDYLEKKAALLLNVTKDDSLAELAQVSQQYVANSEERITILDAGGAIVADTTDASLTGTRSNRPEIKTILQGGKLGVALRHSATLKKELLYVATPIIQDQKINGILRIAEPTANFLNSAAQVRRSIFLVYSLLCLLITLVVLHFLRQKNRPMEKILPVLKKMVAQPEKTELILQTSPQWQELYQTVNQLSEQLSETYQAYTATESQLHTLLDELMIGVFLLDENHQLLMINPAMKQQLGLPQELTLPENLASVIRDPGLIQAIYRVTPATPVLHEEFQLKIPNKRVLDLNLHLFVEQKQLLGISYDLSRVRQLEKMQKDFVGNVSHELKTPVTSLIGFTETLLDGAMEDPTITREFLTIMEKDAHRLERLIQEIIQLSKTDEAQTYEWQDLDLAALYQQLSQSFQHLLQEKQLDLKIEMLQPINWRTVRELFYPIVKNLVENALQYSPENSQVSLRSQIRPDGQLEIQVSDHGIGIDQEDQKRIFERFYRVDKARARNSGGTGLGLAIVKDYTEKLGGHLTLDSHPKVGSTFTVILPPEDK